MIPYTTIPFLSAFCLMLVGVLVGQMFWSRFRNQHQRVIVQLRKKVRQLRQEQKQNLAKRDELHLQISAANQTVEAQGDELAQLRQLTTTLRDEHAESANRLIQETQARRDLAACLADEQQHRVADVDRLQGELQDAESRFVVQRDRSMALDAQLLQVARDLDESRADSEYLREQLSEKIAFIDECQQGRQMTLSQFEQADRQSVLLRQRVAQLEEGNDLLQAELADLGSQHDELTQQLESTQQSLKQQFEDSRGEIETARNESVAEQQRHEEQQRASMAIQNELAYELSMRVDEVERLGEHLQALSDELASADASRHELLEQQDSLAELLRGRQAELDQERAKCRQLDTALGRAKENLESERRETERLAQVEDQLVEMDAEHRQAKDELKSVRQQREHALQAEAATRQIVTELRDELNDRLDLVDTIRREKEITANQLEFERRQRQQIEEALEQSEARLATLQNENDGWSQRQAKLVAQTANLSEQVQRWQAKAGEMEQRGQRAEAQIAELACQLSRQQEMADKMKRRRFGKPDGEPQNEQSGGFSFRDMRVREHALRTQDDQNPVLDPQLGNIYDHPLQMRDDLKKIPGIADRLEEQLNQLGVFTYRQMMEWDPTAIAEVSRRLNLGDTIRSDDWVGSARRLYQDNERNAA